MLRQADGGLSANSKQTKVPTAVMTGHRRFGSCSRRRFLVLSFACLLLLLLGSEVHLYTTRHVPSAPSPPTTNSPLRSATDKESILLDPTRSNHHLTKQPQRHGASNVICPMPSKSFEPLTTFTFWGKTMNRSSPCPTAGLNNQLVMLLSLMHCASTHQRQLVQQDAPVFAQVLVPTETTTTQEEDEESSRRRRLKEQKSDGDGDHNVERGDETTTRAAAAATTVTAAVFRFKDITCSPTGGKDGRRAYQVGGNDYEYEWFRWSELFEFRAPPAPLAAASAVGLSRSVGDSNPRVEGLPHEKEILTARPVTCLHDSYTWSEHPSFMKRCPTTIDHIYGSSEFWALRKSMVLRPWFQWLARDAVEHFAREEGGGGGSGGGGGTTSSIGSWVARAGCALQSQTQGAHLHANTAVDEKLQVQNGIPRFAALHVRRGDYENFCRNTAKSSGVRKFRTAPYMWLHRQVPFGLRSPSPHDGAGNLSSSSASLTPSTTKNSVIGSLQVASLSSKFMSSCFPALSEIVTHVSTIWNRHQDLEFVVLATNSKRFLEELRESLRKWEGEQEEHNKRSRSGRVGTRPICVVSLTEFLRTASARESAARYWHQSSPQWCRKLDEMPHARTEGSSSALLDQVVTPTEASLLDVNVLSMASVIVLNKYSTFSQSVIDFRVSRSGSLDGVTLYWW